MADSAEPLRIAVLSPVWLPTPPAMYGAIEQLASILSEGLVERGHHVTLYASGDSVTSAELRSHCPEAPGWGRSAGSPFYEVPHVLAAYRDIDRYDVFHDHTDPIGPALGAVAAARVPVVHTIHTTPGDAENRPIYELIHDRVDLVAVSHAQRATIAGTRVRDVIHHGLPIDRFEYSEAKGDYLFFIGRMKYGKGLHLAIRAAREAGLPLLVATKSMEFPQEEEYFRTEIQPLLGDHVRLLGEVGFAKKVELYKNARCTLIPTLWDEPFGLTAAESLACGTPVVALNRGATPEIVEHGVTGFLTDQPDELACHIGRVGELSPKDCRLAAETRFSATRMVDSYERLYRRLMSERRFS
ncbi:glycosyltransferase family 4 protein [Nonomuraea sp. NPDC052265]|uniref:glycosyltransferase family 4 protein n=1 Tax=Nonomuraea sp. NPDC052265 TaxID=3364374 RepID=UPI0037CA85AB